MVQPLTKQYYSPDEYLALEAEADYRSEYYQGEIFAMSGGSANHNRITGNLYTELSLALEGKPCEAFFTDMRLLVKENGLYTYPDLMVVCGQLQFVPKRTDTLTNPSLIIEVLSPSTKDYDRGSKFHLYRHLPTLQDYILVEQAKIAIEHFHKMSDGRWILDEYQESDNILHIESLDLEIPLHRIYRNVNWQE